MQVTTSLPLQGAFGHTTIEIESWVAGHPPGGGPCRGYVSGVTMTVTFTEPTNKALMSGKISREQVDVLFGFRWNMGQDYSGEWLDDKTLVITIRDPFGASPPEIGFIVGQVSNSNSVNPPSSLLILSVPLNPLQSGWADVIALLKIS